MALDPASCKIPKGRLWRDATVALGGNVGDVAGRFREAIALLDCMTCKVWVVSSLYLSTPLQLPQTTSRAKPDRAQQVQAYLNAACRLKTLLGPRQLLRRLQKIERQLGRTREHLWAPRTIDLDLITYAASVHETKILTVPHPGIAFRSFVLAPLSDVGMMQPWPKDDLTVSKVLTNQHGLPHGILHKQLSWRL